MLDELFSESRIRRMWRDRDTHRINETFQYGICVDCQCTTTPTPYAFLLKPVVADSERFSSSDPETAAVASDHRTSRREASFQAAIADDEVRLTVRRNDDCDRRCGLATAWLSTVTLIFLAAT